MVTVGFVDGEGIFYVKIFKSKLIDSNYSDVDNKIGQIRLVFSISQHSQDTHLLNKIVEYFNSGAVNTPKTRPNESTVFISKFRDIL